VFNEENLLNKVSVLKFIIIGSEFFLSQAWSQAVDPNKLCPSEDAQGFKSLFDGTAESFRSNFVNYQNGIETNTNLDPEWQLNAAEKAIKSESSTEDARFKSKVHTNPGFDLRWTYRNPGNQGVIYMGTVQGGRNYNTGVEYAIDNRTDENRASPGGAFDIFPPSPNTYRLFSSGLWNDARLVVVGDSVEHWMNGSKVLGYKYHNKRFWDAYDVSKWSASNSVSNAIQGQRGSPGQGYITDGYWSWQGVHGGAWLIRSLRIDTVHAALGAPKNKDWERAALTACESGPTGVVKNDENEKYTLRAIAPQVQQTATELRVDFAELPLKEAMLVSLDGRSPIKARLVDFSTRAVFPLPARSGIYLLKAKDDRHQVVRKIRIF
jgi:hypothetical protein